MLDIADWLAAILEGADETQVWPKAARNAMEEIVRLRAAIARVRALHTSVCTESGTNCGDAACPVRICACGDDWPCPTARALDGDA